MTIAFWCVLAAALLPYIWVIVAKVGARGYDNNAPRAFATTQSGLRQRANWAQYTSFEAFPAFAAGVLIAVHMGVDPLVVNGLALAFVILRLGYGVCYLTDLATMRSVVWFMGFAATVALYVVAATGLAPAPPVVAINGLTGPA